MNYSLLVTFVLFTNAMKRRADRGTREGAQQNPIGPPDLIQSLPIEVIQQHIVPFAKPSAILSLSMTSKFNHGIITTIFKSFYSNYQAIIYDELRGSKDDAQKFEALRHALIKVWPTSANCMERFYLKDTLNALLFEASKGSNRTEDTRRVPLPFFFRDHQTYTFNYVSGTPSCATAVMDYFVYEKLEMSADLLLQVPKDVLHADAGNMLDLLEPEPFKWIPENDPMLRNHLEHYISLFDLDGYGGLDMMSKNQLLVLKVLLEKGLEAGIDCLMEDETFRSLSNIRPLLELMLAMAEPEQMKYLVDALEKSKHLISFIRVLCISPKLSDLTLLDLMEATNTYCRLKTFTVMIDCGRSISEDWLRIGKPEVNRILASYDEEEQRYCFEGPISSSLMEDTWFVAHARNLDDYHLFGLLELFKSNYLLLSYHGLLLLSLQLAKSEAVITRIIIRMKFCHFECMTNPSRNIIIPKTILPQILSLCYQGSALIKLIPDEKKFIEAITYIEKLDLWTRECTLGSVLVCEMAESRKNVFQALLDLAAEKDFKSIANTKLPIDFKNMACAGIFEYVMALPTEKLIKAVEVSPIYENAPTILHMIVKTLLTRPDGFVYLMQHEDPRMSGHIDELVHSAWCSIFPNRKSAFQHSEYLDFYFFDLIGDYSIERLELGVFLYYAAMKYLQQAAEDDSFRLAVPGQFNRRQMEITKEVLRTALKVISLADLAELCSRIEDPLISDLVQAEADDRF